MTVGELTVLIARRILQIDIILAIFCIHLQMGNLDVVVLVPNSAYLDVTKAVVRWKLHGAAVDIFEVYDGHLELVMCANLTAGSDAIKFFERALLVVVGAHLYIAEGLVY